MRAKNLCISTLATLACLGLLAANGCPPQTIQETKLLASDGAGYDHFGISVSVSGDVAVVGAYGDDDNGNGSGSAYVYRFDGTDWVEEAKLLASDGAADDDFGGSVSVSGDVAVVGARYDDDNGHRLRLGLRLPLRWHELGRGGEAPRLGRGGTTITSACRSRSRATWPWSGLPRTTTTVQTPARPTCTASTARTGSRRRSSSPRTGQ